jgi:hypothetical protein
MAFGDFTVTRASTKNVLGSNGLYQSVANNTPAFEFNANGSYRGLLVEPGATNLALRSQEFNTTWGKTDITVTDNSIVAPDGATTADTITEGTAGTAELFQTCTIASGSTATFSIFIKANANNDFVRLIVSQSGSFGNRVQTWFNLTNNTFGNTANVGTATGASVASQALPNGWYRISLTGAIPSVTSYVISVASAASSGSSTTVNNASYYLWQAQLETGSVATSPIVTTGSTASRVADDISLTGASSLIGQTEGTVFIESQEFRQTSAQRTVLHLITDLSNRYQIYFPSANTFRIDVNGLLVFFGPTINSGTTYKIAFAYKSGEYALYINGVQEATSASTTMPSSLNDIQFGNQGGGEQVNGNIGTLALFPTRLSNAQLASLTTL